MRSAESVGHLRKEWQRAAANVKRVRLMETYEGTLKGGWRVRLLHQKGGGRRSRPCRTVGVSGDALIATPALQAKRGAHAPGTR